MMTRRVWSGPFDLEGAVTLDRIEALARTPELDEVIRPLEDALADLPVGDVFGKFHDPPNYFVAHDHAGGPPSAFAGEAVHVASADPDRLHLDQYLPSFRFGLGQVLQRHFPWLLVYQRFHAFDP